jgi:hypothetical protein
MELVARYPEGEVPFPKEVPVLAPTARALPLDTATNKVLAWGIGALMGILTLTTEYVGAPRDIFSRVAPVDVVCLALMAMLFFRHRMKVPPMRSMVYAAAIVISLVPALLFTGGDQIAIWTSASALLMAFAYYLVGLNIAASPVLMRCMLWGLCLGVAAETVVVLHDTIFSSSQWFPDPMEGRVRGTFKTNGQLAAYSFCAAGLLLTFGTTQGSRIFRRLCMVLGLVAASFSFMASRRMGMLSVFLWAGLFTVLAWRFTEKRSYKVFVASFFCALVALVLMWPQIQETFVAQRFTSAVDGITKEEGFIQNQFKSVVVYAGRWFPWGLGVGQGAHVNPDFTHEIHNGLLAVMVELGVLGLLAFLAMILYPIFKRRWHRRSRDHDWLGTLMTAFQIIGIVFMFHNTLARDRPYLLFVGIATTIAIQESFFNRPSVYFPERKTEGDKE